MSIKDIAAFVRHVARMRIIRTGIVGGIGVVVQTIVFDLVGIYFHIVSPSTATVIGGELGVLTAFVLNNRYSFGDRTGHWPTRLARFHIVTASSLAIQWISVFSAEHLTQNIVLIHAAYAFGIVIGFLFNYAGYHLFVWRRAHASTTQ